LTQARVDPRVVGLILSGSQVHEGMPTIHSDYDVHVTVGDDGTDLLKELEGFRSSHLDLAVMPLADFRFCGLPGHPLSWMRYAYVHARVVLDRLDGKIADIPDSKRTLAPEEAHSHVDTFLDAYINSVYRSLKSSRDGRHAEAHLDAAESIPYVLEVLFALHQRVRPYNKYLRWELEQHPLSQPGWGVDQLLPELHRILATGSPASQRSLFARIDQAARAAGHGDVLDGWGTDLTLMHGQD
jgi:hypothetical protein